MEMRALGERGNPAVNLMVDHADFVTACHRRMRIQTLFCLFPYLYASRARTIYFLTPLSGGYL